VVWVLDSPWVYPSASKLFELITPNPSARRICAALYTWEIVRWGAGSSLVGCRFPSQNCTFLHHSFCLYLSLQSLLLLPKPKRRFQERVQVVTLGHYGIGKVRKRHQIQVTRSCGSFPRIFPALYISVEPRLLVSAYAATLVDTKGGREGSSSSLIFGGKSFRCPFLKKI